MAEIGKLEITVLDMPKNPKVIEEVRENTKAACLEKSRKNNESEE